MKKDFKDINYYGDKDNYIHAKFGDLRKCYNFTKDFIKRYPRFSEEFGKYWLCEESMFSNPLEIVNYIIRFKIPVHAYFNFTDTPATWKEVQKYLGREYMGNKALYKLDKDEDGHYTYYSLDSDKMKEDEDNE